MDYYKLNRLIGLANLAVVAYFILEKGIQIQFLPLLVFSVMTTISSSPQILGLGLIIGSLDLSILFIRILSLFLLLQALILTVLSILSLKIKIARFIPLPLSILLYIFSPDISLYLYSFTVLGSVLILFERKIYPNLLLLLALPFFLTQLFFLYSFSIMRVGFSPFLILNEMAKLSKFMLPADIIVLIISFLKRNSLYTSLSTLVIIASLGVAVAFLFIKPDFSLMYSSSSAIVASSTLSNDDIEELILSNLDNQSLLVDLFSLYKRDITSFYCKLAEKENCKAIVKIPEALPFKINYSLCDLHKIANCFEKLNQVPSRDIISFLSVAKEKDIELAERIGKLALSVTPNPKLIKIMDEIEISRREHLKYNWDPKVWLNREIFGYKIVDYLGKGGSAYVLVGEKDEKKYAVKIPILMPPNNATESYYDFINEYSQLRELSQRSNNIVKFIDARIDSEAIKRITQGDVLAYLSDPPILVMEYMEGKSVKELINNDNIFYSDEWQKIVILIALRVAKALDEIHSSGFVHLDIKPSNILFSSPPGRTGKEVLDNLYNNKVEVKISDLGSARKTGEKFIQYTPEYCSIDQVEAIIEGKGADPSMDIYALGATLYKMLTRNDFNPPELIKLFNEASFAFSQKRDPKPILEEARKIYKEFYEKLEIPEVNSKLVDLIKQMVHPDKRPSANEVYNRLKEILNNNERSSDSGQAL
ncbi:serine/threonine-protein kinase [Sulfurisphaera javensis]|uniref:Serine/threonine-protein kinase n=1 Tax=Sulfurisphaera javensis TaxID=2049879 RepID=A0AAT9GSP7_9CREN